MDNLEIPVASTEVASEAISTASSASTDTTEGAEDQAAGDSPIEVKAGDPIPESSTENLGDNAADGSASSEGQASAEETKASAEPQPGESAGDSIETQIHFAELAEEAGQIIGDSVPAQSASEAAKEGVPAEDAGALDGPAPSAGESAPDGPKSESEPKSESTDSPAEKSAFERIGEQDEAYYEEQAASKLAPEIRAIQDAMSEMTPEQKAEIGEVVGYNGEEHAQLTDPSEIEAANLKAEFDAAVAAGLPVGEASKAPSILESPVGTGVLAAGVIAPGDAPAKGATLVNESTRAATGPWAGHDEVAEPEPEETVDMVFPKRVILTTQDRTQHDFPKGVNPVPVSLKDHDYLAVNGVTLFVPPPTRELAPVIAGASTMAPLDSRLTK